MQVFKCKCLLNNKYYALKEIPKLKLSTYNFLYSSIKEPSILKDLIRFDFLSTIIVSFQDYDNLYLITTYFEGDILYKYKDQIMSEEEIKFISACVIQSLVYLRRKNIINRDIRMKNLIMDNKRYFNLIDFSFAIKYTNKDNFKNDITGHKNESAPEILNHSKYDYNSDYYRIGTIIYYLIFKKYANSVKKENNKNELFIDSNEIKNYSSNCIDFLNKLIITNYKERIGFKSINELKQHKWFNGFDWKNFEKKKMESPLKFFRKKFNKAFCKNFMFSNKMKIMHQKYIMKNNYKRLIKKYDFVNKFIVNNILNSFKNNS